jgi:uncharacterized protein (TIRG00374 family)
MKSKRILVIVLKCLVAAGILFFLFKKYDPQEIAKGFLQVPSYIWLLACIIIVFQTIVGAVKWHLLIPSYQHKELFRILSITGLYSLVLPGQLASEVVKVFLLGGQHKEYEKTGASVIVDKITGLTALLFLGSIGVLFSQQALPAYLSIVFLLSGLLMISMLYLINISIFQKKIINITTYLATKNKLFKKLSDIMQKLINSWIVFSANRLIIIKSILCGMVYQGLNALTGALLCYAVQVDLGIIDWFWIETFLSILLLLPISIGGLGLREGTLMGLLGSLAVPPEKILIISFGLFAQLLMRAAVGGVFELHRHYKLASKSYSSEQEKSERI